MTGTAPFRWPGSKRQLAEWILDYMPDHRTYVEVFGGSAAVLMTKECSRIEVYNDIDSELVNFFTVFRDQTDALVDWLQKTPFSRELYDKYVTAYYDGGHDELNDIERAGRFFYLRYTQFGGKVNGRAGFGMSKSRSHPANYQNSVDRLDTLASRFRDVCIECEDWQSIFDRYDHEQTFFYLDPPYVDTEDTYSQGGFNHREFITELKSLDAKWMVSYDELPPSLDPSTMDIVIAEKSAKHHTGTGANDGAKTVIERLVMNYDADGNKTFTGHNQNSAINW